MHSRSLLKSLAVGAIALLLITSCRAGGEPKLQLPAVKLGNNISVVVHDVKFTDTVYYHCSGTETSSICGTAEANYFVSASAPDRELFLALVEVANRDSEIIIMHVGNKGYTVLDEQGVALPSTNPFGSTRRLAPTIPAKESLYSFIWGKFEIPKQKSITAWTIFEIPKTVNPWQVRWDTVETVFVNLYKESERPNPRKV